MKFMNANIEDIPQLSKLLGSLFQEETEFYVDESVQIRGITKILENCEIGSIIIAKESDKIVGMINILFTISTALGARVALLEDMIISKNYRNQGIGSKLIKYAIKFAKDNECLRITLLTDEDNYIAHSFYTKEGFSRSTMVPFRMML